MTKYAMPALRKTWRSATLAVSLFAVSMLAASMSATAAEPKPAGTGGSAEAGATKNVTCIACHGPNGNSVNPEWPSIAGQNANYLAEQIKLVRDNKRVNVLMYPMVKDLTDQDAQDLGAYYASQTPTGLEADPSYWKAGEKLYRGGDVARSIPACMACHGPVGRGNPAAAYPALRAQHAVYTSKQLDAYAAETRYMKDAKGRVQAGPNVQIMAAVAARLTAEDRRNLASYIQGMR